MLLSSSVSSLCCLFKGPRTAVVEYKIAPNRFKTTYRSILTFEEQKQTITHLFKTVSGLRLGCNAFILAKRSENTVNWTFQNQRHFKWSTVGQWRHKQTSNQTWKSGLCECAQGNRLGQISSSNLQGWNSFSVAGPLFISPLLFHLSRALLGAWRFGLFRCVYSSFHNRLDLIREPAFYWCFILFSQISLVCFIICNNEKGLFVLVQ